MHKTNTIRSVMPALLLIAFLCGVCHLFVLRFQSGDVYPAYSSLRSDPLGTRVLYESLENFNAITLRRNYHFLHSLRPEPGTTFFYIGASAADYNPVPRELVEISDRLAKSGGRLVLSFLPVIRKNAQKSEPKRESRLPEPENIASQNEPNENSPVSIKTDWGVGFASNPNLKVKDGSYLALDAVSHRQNLPPVISWHSNLYFELLDESWQVLYTSEGHPVIVERPFGKGSLVLCADSFFFSNEALWSERHPLLLVWLLGRNSAIIFDEAHFGIYKQPSVAALLRHYRFDRIIWVLAVMAILFVWKNAVYFVPPRKDDVPSGTDVVSDKDYTRGLIAMLRRNISGNEILQVCGREWEQTYKNDKRLEPETFERVKEILQTKAHSSKKRLEAVAGYRKISRTVQRTKGYE